MTSMRELRYFTYTHTNCWDIWSAYFGQLEIHSPQVAHTVIVNKLSHNIPVPQIEYNDNKNYCQEYARCLKRVEEEFIIYMQEDFYLYEDVYVDGILEYMDILKSDGSISFIRLIKTGEVSDIHRYGLKQPQAAYSHR